MPETTPVSDSEPVSVWAALRWIVLHPWHAVGRRWNYKAAILSSILRAAVFWTTNLSAGSDAALAWLAEPRGAAFAEAIRAAAGGDLNRVFAARETVERFRWRVATRRYFETYDDLHRRFSVDGVIGSCSRRAPAA